MKNLNNKLTKLYSDNWLDFARKLEEIKESELTVKPTNPLLITVQDEYKYINADIRVMIFGQETNDWGGDFMNDIKHIISIYEDFFSSKHCFKYGGQFWNGISRFLKMLELQNPNKSIEFIWNNVIKVGKSGKKGKPPEYIYHVEKENFRILNEEMQILQPNLVLFLSGPYYDNILIEQFKDIGFQNIEEYQQKQIAKVNLLNCDSAFRTYHPNYLWRNGIDNYFEAILKETKIRM